MTTVVRLRRHNRAGLSLVSCALIMVRASEGTIDIC